MKGIVEAHGGTIAVQQAPGGGAEFRFTMPAGTLTSAELAGLTAAQGPRGR